jgi:hypothetical protein
MAAGELRFQTPEAPAGSDALGDFVCGAGGSLGSDLMFSFGLVRVSARARSALAVSGVLAAAWW